MHISYKKLQKETLCDIQLSSLIFLDAYVLNGSSILKLFDIAATYASPFSPANIEHCSPITMFMNRETFRFVWCFSRFNYPFLIWEIPVWFVSHYTLIAYHYVFFSYFLKIFSQYFLFLWTVNKQAMFFDCWLILCKCLV